MRKNRKPIPKKIEGKTGEPQKPKDSQEVGGIDESQFDSIAAEIEAIVQNTGKKKISSDITKWVEIDIDKKKSTPESICGEFAIIKQTRFLDGSTECEDIRRHSFLIDENDDLMIEKYDIDHPLIRDVMKPIRDSIFGIREISRTGTMRFKLDNNKGFECKDKKIMVICETGKNIAVKNTVNELIFTGQAHSHVDTGTWQNSNYEKCMHWAFLEIERRVHNGETVVVSGCFDKWYQFMPLVVISKQYNHDLVIGRTAGQRLAIGNIIDINLVLEHFLDSSTDLSQFYQDPYSAIEHFKNIDSTISSLVIFPSILHKFLSR